MSLSYYKGGTVSKEMTPEWRELHDLYQAALGKIREALANIEREGKFTKAEISSDGGLHLFRDGGRGKLLRFPHFTCGDPDSPASKMAVHLLEFAGFGSSKRLVAVTALDRVTLIRHASGLVFIKGQGYDRANDALATELSQ